MTEQEFKALKRQHQEAVAAAAEARGALASLKEQLKREFNLASVDEAKAFLKRLKAKRDKLEQTFERELRAYKQQWT